MNKQIFSLAKIEELEFLSKRLPENALRVAKKIAKTRNYTNLSVKIDEKQPEYTEQIRKMVDIFFEKGAVGVYAIGADSKNDFEKLEDEPFGETTKISRASGKINFSGIYIFTEYGVVLRVYRYELRGKFRTGYEAVAIQEVLDGIFEASRKPFFDFYADYVENMFYSFFEMRESALETVKNCFDDVCF